MQMTRGDTMMFNAEQGVMHEKARRIKLLVLDVDGVMTDGTLTYNGRGDEIKKFNVYDGLGLKLLMKAGVAVALVTSRQSEAVQKRAHELGITLLYQNADKKLTVYDDILHALHLSDAEVSAAGDDLMDLPLLRRCGLSFSVANGVAEVKKESDYVTVNAGGHGAVREICEIIIKAKGLWADVTAQYY